MMRALLALVLVFPFAVRADEPDPEPPAPDVKKLEGEWEVVSIRSAGREMKVPAGLSLSVTFSRDKMTTRQTPQGGKTRETVSTWKIDARKSPAHIDQTSTATKRTSFGIYKLNRDELTIATSSNPGDRPKDFATAQRVMVLKRKKK
jgi:uncharacterized protein (TIGR03067 family)